MTTTEPPRKILVGFWLRFVADGLDALLLTTAGLLLVLPFREAVYRLGDRGVWIGWPVAFLYTGILHTSTNQGQSVAKWLLGIQVVRRDGTFMSLPRSLLRYTIINVLFFGNLFLAGLAATFPALATTATYARLPRHVDFTWDPVPGARRYACWLAREFVLDGTRRNAHVDGTSTADTGWSVDLAPSGRDENYVFGMQATGEKMQVGLLEFQTEDLRGWEYRFRVERRRSLAHQNRVRGPTRVPTDPT